MITNQIQTNKKSTIILIVLFLYTIGGDGESRTHVRKFINTNFSECSKCLNNIISLKHLQKNEII